MKAKITMFVAIAMLSLTVASAQFRPFNGGGSGNATVDPATIVANRVAFLTTLLTLTSAQVTQATTIFTNELAAETAVRTNLDTAETSLQAAIKSNSTTTIDSLASQIGGYQGQLVSIEAKAQAAFYAILTADQQTKYNALGPGAGGPGHGPGRP